jgi:hypothetical protein
MAKFAAAVIIATSIRVRIMNVVYLQKVLSIILADNSTLSTLNFWLINSCFLAFAMISTTMNKP